MSLKIVWLACFLLLYVTYCLVQAILGARATRHGNGFAQANGFALAKGAFFTITLSASFVATSFAGWLLVAHPAGVYESGLAYGAVAFMTIAMSLTAVIFYRRLWQLSRHFDLITPGQIFAQYFRSDAMRILIALIATAVATPFLAMSFKVSGDVLHVLSDETLTPFHATLICAAIPLAYTLIGGMRAIVRIGFVQAIFLVLVVGILCVTVLDFMGGWEVFTTGLKSLSQADEIRTPNGASHYVAVTGLSRDLALPASSWPLLSSASRVFAFTGLIVGPAFCMWAFAQPSPGALMRQQVFGLGAGLGVILFVFLTVIGFAGHFLGANLAMTDAFPDLVYNVLASGLGAGDIMEHPQQARSLMPILINLLGQTGSAQEAALSGFLGVAALAVMQAAAGAILHFSSVIIASDGVLVEPSKRGARLVCLLLVGLAVGLTFVPGIWIDGAGNLSLAIGCQMWPALLGLCYVPRFTASAIICGVITGCAGAFVTSQTGVAAFEAMNTSLPWGAEPFGIDAAVWGVGVNLIITAGISILRQNPEELAQRAHFHSQFVTEGSVRSAKLLIILLCALWGFFALGPGALMGNEIFADSREPDSWIYNLPSLWMWQALWWVIGIFVVWIIAVRLGRTELGSTGLK